MRHLFLICLSTLLCQQAAAAVTFDFEAAAPPPGFAFAGDAPWTVDDTRAYEGSRSLRSGSISDGQTSEAILEVTVDDLSALTFSYLVEEGWGPALHVYVDGAIVATRTDASEWTSESIDLAAGTHGIRWSFEADWCCSSAADAAWIDDVRIQSLLDPDERVQLEWMRTEASWGFSPGYEGLALHDVTGDGRLDVIASAESRSYQGVGYWYVASWRNGQLEKTSISPGYAEGIIDLRRFRTPDGRWQLAIATGGMLYLHNLPTLSLESSYPLHEGTRFVALGDVDADGDLDLVSEGPSYYSSCPCIVTARDLTSGEQLWQVDFSDGELFGFGLADLTAEPGLEIVLGREPGLVLSGTTGSILWEYPLGFGRDIAFGNFDDDPGIEFAAIHNSEVGVFDAAVQSPLWSLPAGWDSNALAAHDTNADGRDEILVGDGQWGAVHVYSSITRQEIHAVDNPEHGVGGITSGDVTGDGIADIVFGAGDSSSGTDSLLLGDMSSATPAWVGNDEAPPVRDLEIADVDGDGRLELAYVTKESESGYTSGRLHVLDAATFEERFTTEPFAAGRDWLGAGGVDAAQLDADAALELVVGTADIRDPQLEIYDGRTGALERTVPVPGSSYDSAAMFPRVIAGNRVIIVQENRVKERSLADGATLWESVSLQSEPLAHAIGNVDADASLESVVLARGGYLVSVDLATHLFDWLIEIPGAAGMSVDTARKEILIAVPAGIQRYDAQAEALLMSYPTRSPAIGVWTANHGPRHLLFAATESHTIEVFDADTGARVAAEPMRGPGVGRAVGAVVAPNAAGPTMWAVSDYAVHQFGAALDVRPLFVDGFE